MQGARLPQDSLEGAGQYPGATGVEAGHDGAAHGAEGVEKTPTSTKAAERQRRYRLRQRAGVQVVTVDIDADTLHLMIDLGYITEAEAEDRQRVGEVVMALAFHHLLSGEKPVTRNAPSSADRGKGES